MNQENPIRESVRPAVVLFLALTVVAGMAYPLLVTSIAQALFPWQANGSLVTTEGRPAKSTQNATGSQLIGQPFSDPRYFWGRPSATTPFPYNAAASSGSNLGPLNSALADAVRQRVAALSTSSPPSGALLPVDLVTSSASGLDPHLSPAAALYQAPRVAAERHLSFDQVQVLVQRYTEGRMLGILGEPRVNVLLLNLALDRMSQPYPSREVDP